MSASKPLQGIELVDCASANAKSGIEVAARQCGYGEDLETFWQSLQAACEQMGVSVEQMSDLAISRETTLQSRGLEIAPDSDSIL